MISAFLYSAPIPLPYKSLLSEYIVNIKLQNNGSLLLNIENGALLAFKMWFILLNNDRSVAGRYDSPLVLSVSITKCCRCLDTSIGFLLVSKSNGTGAITLYCIGHAVKFLSVKLHTELSVSWNYSTCCFF